MSELTLQDLVTAPSIPAMVVAGRHLWPAGEAPRCRVCPSYFGHEYDGLGHILPAPEVEAA